MTTPSSPSPFDFRFVLPVDIGDGAAARNTLVSLAQTAETGRRFEDMCAVMHALVAVVSDANGELTMDERTLLSIA
jgi:hypothetical protein